MVCSLSSYALKSGKVLGARRFGENLVFFRTAAGLVSCADARCAHRKASLEKGWIQDDHVEDTWNVDYSRVIENQQDVSHLAFVHHNTIGRGNKTLCNGPKVVWLDNDTMQTSADNEVDYGQMPKLQNRAG